MILTIETEQDEDGRWIAEVWQLPGALVYGASRTAAVRGVEALALRLIADRLDHGETIPDLDSLFSVMP